MLKTMFRRHTTTLHQLLRFGAAVCALVAVWLFIMISVVLPNGNADLIPFWSLIAIIFLLYGWLTWVYLHRLHVHDLRLVMAIFAMLGFLAGLAALAIQAFHALWRIGVDGYVVFMGLILVGQSILLFLQVFRRHKSHHRHWAW